MTKSQTSRVCPICDNMVQQVFDFLRRYQHDLVSNPVARELHAQRGGFCAFHSRQYEFLASPQGVCEGYSAFLQSVGERLLAIAAEAVTVDEVVCVMEKSPTARPACSVCEVVSKAEEEALSAALAQMAAAMTKDTTPLFCIAHLTALVSRLTDLDIVRRLLERHGDEFKRVAEDMRQYVAKRDSLQRHLLTIDEQEAYLRGLMLLKGHRRLAASPESH